MAHWMTQVLVTVDTELSALLHQRGISARANMESSINGRCGAGSFGIGWQMDQLEARGLKGVFFVDPMPGLLYGEAIIADIVAPIIARGHEVQLHIHTEWLEWVADSPVEGRQGRDLADFSFEDQVILLGLAADMIERAGAPRPTAFRAGNYGANDDSLRALAALGLVWDSSVNAPYLGSACRISAAPDAIAAHPIEGVIELPVAGLFDQGQNIRPAQICALSAAEMKAALTHAAREDHGVFVIVTHSFEMLSRDRCRPNRSVMRRFEAMCDVIAANPGLHSAGFADLDPKLAEAGRGEQRLGPDRWRTRRRMIEQMLATLLYEHRLRPA
jgi:peptidoglycan/xylan/chitin deacetylase (PgdA/CDA1 family)